MHAGKSGMFSGKVGYKTTWDIFIKAWFIYINFNQDLEVVTQHCLILLIDHI
jgi:hypothetical protein